MPGGKGARQEREEETLMALSAMTFLKGIALGGSSAAVVLLIVDYIRLRRAEYVAMQAAKAVAALNGNDTAVCTESTTCKAFRSAACVDGRCRYHCRLSCKCKGNQ